MDLGKTLIRRVGNILPAIIILLLQTSLCPYNSKTEVHSVEFKKSKYEYHVNRLERSLNIDADWGKVQWGNIKAIRLDNYMGSPPCHFPSTEFRLCYDDENIYVIFRVKDQYVRAVAKETHGRVWEDSCVEFFFTPGEDVNQGYFNIEMNCKGIFLIQYHDLSSQEEGFVDLDDCNQVEVAWSLKRDATDEIKEPQEWTVEYSLPFKILEKYMKVDKPCPGTIWRANFYKCADKTSHPHWLTWAPVNYPEPKFHLPEFFGLIEFE